jgi:hypothetical protein
MVGEWVVLTKLESPTEKCQTTYDSNVELDVKNWDGPCPDIYELSPRKRLGVVKIGSNTDRT